MKQLQPKLALNWLTQDDNQGLLATQQKLTYSVFVQQSFLKNLGYMHRHPVTTNEASGVDS